MALAHVVALGVALGCAAQWALDSAGYLLAAVVVAAISALASVRFSEDLSWAPEVLVAQGLVVAGRPVEAMACAVLIPLVLATRKRLVWYCLLANVGTQAFAVLAMHQVFVATTLSGPTFSWRWLLGLGLGVTASFAITFIGIYLHSVACGFAPFVRTCREAWRDLASDLGFALPVAGAIGVVLSQDSIWYLPVFVLPVALAADIHSRSERLVESTIASRQLRDSFSRYVPSSVVDHLVDGEDQVQLGGEQREITVLFADIRGFTSWSEKHPPAVVVRELNGLLSVISTCVFETGGTLDKFTGDGLMAFWGAPLEQPDHAQRAVEAACLMVSRLDEFNANNKVQFRMGVGIHTGSAVVGNIGHADRHDYTAIGDTVNLSARLEAATPNFDTSVLISEATRAKLGEEQWYLFDPRGSIQVKGREQPVTVLRLHETRPSEKYGEKGDERHLHLVDGGSQGPAPADLEQDEPEELADAA